jgi:hypothetical protein
MWICQIKSLLLLSLLIKMPVLKEILKIQVIDGQ